MIEDGHLEWVCLCEVIEFKGNVLSWSMLCVINQIQKPFVAITQRFAFNDTKQIYLGTGIY